MGSKSDPRPRHQQIAAEIRAAIMSGDLPPGTKLPPTQQLVTEYGVTNQTVQRTLSVLKGEGFLVGRTGVGVYVRERARSPFAQPRTCHQWLPISLTRG
ncbi:MAG: GntR family transcriptional regulator [Mycobacteriales bacterium]